MMQAEDTESLSWITDKPQQGTLDGSPLARPPDVVSGPFTSLTLDLNDVDDLEDHRRSPAIMNGVTMPSGGHDGSRKERSFLLMDEQERICVKSADQFCKRLSVQPETKVKVVSIFGNTGDGKSHTMNHALFGGRDVFKTSSEQAPGTMGIWAAYQRQKNVLCLDTEGLLGETVNENRQMRMLLKVLAVSDIIIYRTRAERLRTDMYKFLGTASKAFTKYFSGALQALDLPGPPQALGPAVIIFHETHNTEVLKEDDDGKKEEDILRERFAKLRLELSAFSSLRYVGVRTTKPPTNYEPLRMVWEKEIRNTAVRSPRLPRVVFETLLALNNKFNGELSPMPFQAFPEQYFTCTTVCKSCDVRCQLSMGHLELKEDHRSVGVCKYQHQHENKVYLCNRCHVNGRQVVVTIKTQKSTDSSWMGLALYAWSGSVIECPHCGEIYRSRQHWYGNKSPEQNAVRTEIVHVWNDGGLQLHGPKHSAQLVLDGVAYITDAMASVGSQPTKLVKSWVTDKIRPTYWRPDSEIIYCKGCTCNFERLGLKKHHCRSCGEGFCNFCSKHESAVPSRGWNYPVRVCNSCWNELRNGGVPAGATAAAVVGMHNGDNANGDDADDQEHQQQHRQCNGGGSGNMNNNHNNNNNGVDEANNVLVRRYGEAVINTISNIGAVLEYPKDFIKDSARPSYWVPDGEAPNCYICDLLFGSPEELNTVTPLIQATTTTTTTTTTTNGAGGSTSTTASPSPSPAKQQNGSTSTGSAKQRSRSTAATGTATGSGTAPAPQMVDRRRHHCRACGNAVCAICSQNRRPVPKRGWLSDVRVCNTCYTTED
ncbi:zinc finger FYVE domain-containing protein 1-like isoform X2 [Anopheles darlingi]|uniref:zinc finger FYVE domain-containing protein 1-like isoform X2 n=1 Tax=Anopheles darlingi TaxID=43151 RepID=UPI0021005E34|nr:zinc finger FYVE domain-containing protein 1-like isoform X2 [Anopheles darlingi]